MKTEEKIALFLNTVQCDTVADKPIFLFCYDRDLRLISSNCPKELLYDSLLAALGCKETLAAYFAKNSMPISLGTEWGFIWNAALERESGDGGRIYVLGPVFSMDISQDSYDDIVARLPEEVSSPARYELQGELRHIPVVTQSILTQDIIKLHYCLNGEYISNADMFSPTDILSGLKPNHEETKRGHRMWQLEQELLEIVRTGDTVSLDTFSKAVTKGDYFRFSAGDPLRYAKSNLVVFTTLCSRAAIEGGLAPWKSYKMFDTYVDNAEKCGSIPEAYALIKDMYESYVTLVRGEKKKHEITPQMKRCCDYIELHAENKLKLDSIADEMGYSKAYLSRRFKKELGMTIGEYIRKAKVDRAEFLLETTDDDIQDIADRLGFCSRSYFAEVFRQLKGCAPIDYRNGQLEKDR